MSSLLPFFPSSTHSFDRLHFVRWGVATTLIVIGLLIPRHAMAAGTYEVSAGCGSCDVSGMNARMQQIINEGNGSKCRWSDGSSQPNDRGCWRTDSPAVVTNPGVMATQSSPAIFANCDGNCGNPESSDPGPITLTLSLTVTVQKDVRVTFGQSVGASGGIPGVVEIEAELNGAIAAGNQLTCTSTASATKTVNYCKWTRVEITQSVIRGKKAQITHTYTSHETIRSQPGQTCPYDGEQVLRPNCPSDVSTAEGDVCVGTATVNAVANGTCPPPPPAN